MPPAPMPPIPPGGIPPIPPGGIPPIPPYGLGYPGYPIPANGSADPAPVAIFGAPAPGFGDVVAVLADPPAPPEGAALFPLTR